MGPPRPLFRGGGAGDAPDSRRGARHYQRIKHGSGADRVDLDSAIAGMDPGLTDLVAVDEALTRLGQTDPRKAQVVTLRYFAGLSVEETAGALGLSPATVKSEWAFARAWLYRALGPVEPSS